MISVYKKKNQGWGWAVVNCCTYHQSHFGAQLLLSSRDHGQSSSCSYLQFVVIFTAKQHQQLQLIVAIFQVAILHLKHTEFISFPANLLECLLTVCLPSLCVCSCPHLFTCHQVAHAFSGSQSDLVILFKHVVLNLGQSLLFHNLHSTKTDEGYNWKWKNLQNVTNCCIENELFNVTVSIYSCDLKQKKKISPQFFTETSQVGETSQSFIVLHAVSVCVKEVH